MLNIRVVLITMLQVQWVVIFFNYFANAWTGYSLKNSLFSWGDKSVSSFSKDNIRALSF